MFNRSYFATMMVEMGDADAMVCGVYTKYTDAIKPALEIVGTREGIDHIAALNIVNTAKGTFFLADTLVNNHPSVETLEEIVKLTNDSVKIFNVDPVIAMLSYSNFGADNTGSPVTVHKAVENLHKNHPEILVDGEMQVNFALDKDLRSATYPFSKLEGKDVNTLIFPNLSSANITYKTLLSMGLAENVGPVQMGLKKPIYVCEPEASVRDIMNIVTIAVIDAQINGKK